MTRPRFIIYSSTMLHRLGIFKWQGEIIHIKNKVTRNNKFEIRISKSETNSNDQNPNNQNNRAHSQSIHITMYCASFVLNFENSNFGFVSNFEFRASDFKCIYIISEKWGMLSSQKLKQNYETEYLQKE
jgi:hypothetical protein